MFGSLLENLFKAPPPQSFTDVLSLEKTGKPNEALIVPVGAPMPPAPGKLSIIQGALYDLKAEALLKRCTAFFLSTYQCTITSEMPMDGTTTLCVRTPLMRYPDLVYFHAMPVIGDTPRATLGAYSHSIYGQSDLGANKARLTALIESLKAVQID